MYVALVGDGTLLPPVIFTNDTKLPASITADPPAFVYPLTTLKAPSANTTLRWLDTVSDYFEPGDIITHDRGSEFVNRKVPEDIEARELADCPMPSWGGSFVNPCDNSFNSKFKYRYYSDRHHNTHNDMIESMVRAYYAASESSIKNYFAHCKYSGPTPTRKDMEALLTEGYRASPGHEELHKRCYHMYISWKHSLRFFYKGTDTKSQHGYQLRNSRGHAHWHAHSFVDM